MLCYLISSAAKSQNLGGANGSAGALNRLAVKTLDSTDILNITKLLGFPGISWPHL